jgi:hypothetical protein
MIGHRFVFFRGGGPEIIAMILEMLQQIGAIVRVERHGLLS